MQEYIEKSKSIPISYETDVLVVGGGPAGVGASMRAAETGVATMLIETQGCIGGIATAGMMSHWGGRSSSKIYKKIIERSKAVNTEETPIAYGENVIHHEKLKYLLHTMLAEAGVKVLLYTTACDTVVENNKVTGVIIENKDGRSLIKANVVVDASGDGDVAARAGVPFFLGRETDHKMQPATIMFKVGGVDVANAVFPGSFETKVETPKGELQALAKELLPFPAGHVLLYRTTLPGVVCCNMTNCIEVDGTKAEDLTRATYVCQSQMQAIVEFLRAYAPGYADCFLLTAASLIGIRETRHFEGIKSLSSDEILQAAYHEDWAVREAYFNFDVHNMSGASLDKTGVQRAFTQKNTYTIPYGCLVPQKIDGLLLSGRNISGSHLAHSNFRIMTVCVALGEAAGAAAAISCQKGIAIRDVAPQDIQRCVE